MVNLISILKRKVVYVEGIVIIGLVLMGLAGCAGVPYARTDIREYEKPAVILKEDKTILKNFLYESISNIEKKEYDIKAQVKETSENTIKYDTLNSAQKVQRKDTVRGTTYYWILGSPTSDYNGTIEGPEKVISSRTYTTSSERTVTLYSAQPKSGIPVKFSSKHFKFDDNLESIITETDENGYAIVAIKSYPLLWRVTERELTLALSNNLQDQIKDASIRDKITSSLKIEPASYPIEIETVNKGKIIQNEGNPYYSEVKNDKETFNVEGYKLNLGELYEDTKNLINGELKERCLAHLYIQVRDIESHFPINNAMINLKQKKTMPIEKLLAEEEDIRKKYFVEGSEIFKGTKIDVSPLLVDLSGQRSIQLGGIDLVSNIGSEYDIEVTHPEYRFLQGALDFNKETNSKTIEMISLGSKIRTQETQEKGGKIINTE